MPPRNPELPEGTDHIVNGAMETSGAPGAGSGSSGAATGGLSGSTTAGTGSSGGASGGGGTSSGFIGGSDTSVLGDDTGGLAAGRGGNPGGFGSGGGSQGGTQGGKAVDQLKGSAQNLRQQATDKVREYAEDGKSRATTALADFSNVIRETADSIDDKLGAEYGQYARRAAEAVSDFADNIRNKEVDELYEDARAVVRKSPVVAIGTAAAVGFALVRLIKAGIPQTETDVEFEPDPSLGTSSTGPAGTPPSVTPATGA